MYLEIVGGGHSAEAITAELREIALRLCRCDHIETIVLAGTELALAFSEATAGFPAIDCTRLHVEGRHASDSRGVKMMVVSPIGE